MAFPAIATAQALGEFKQNFRWDINFSPVISLIAGATGYPIPTAARLNFLCTTSGLPKKTMNMAEILLRNGVKLYQAGTAEMGGTLTFTFVDTIENDAQNMMDNWGNLQFNTTDGLEGSDPPSNSLEGWGSGGAPSLYKCTLPIVRVNNLKQIIYGLKLLGTQYQDFDPGGDLDTSTGDVTKPTLTVQYDGWVRMKQGNLSLGG